MIDSNINQQQVEEITQTLIGKYFLCKKGLMDCFTRVDFKKQKVSDSFMFMDGDWSDSDCSEDYDNDDFYQ